MLLSCHVVAAWLSVEKTIVPQCASDIEHTVVARVLSAKDNEEAEWSLELQALPDATKQARQVKQVVSADRIDDEDGCSISAGQLLLAR